MNCNLDIEFKGSSLFKNLFNIVIYMLKLTKYNNEIFKACTPKNNLTIYLEKIEF